MFRNVLCLLSFCVLLHTTQANGAVSFFTNELAYDQAMEKISLYVDDNPIETLYLKQPKPTKGTLAFPKIKDMASYRLAGAADIDGDEYAILGAGILLTESRLNELFSEATPLTQLFAAYIDMLAQAKKSIAQIVTKEELKELTELEITRPLTQDTPQTIKAAEKRLDMPLPASLAKYLTETGTFHTGMNDYNRFHLFSAAEIISVAQWLSEQSDGDRSERKEIQKTLIKRHPAAETDLVIGVSNGEEPIILRVSSDTQCKTAQVRLSLPGNDINLLLATESLTTLIASYSQVVASNDKCYDLASLYREQLRSHIESSLSAFLTVLSPSKHYGAHREYTYHNKMRVWIRFTPLE